MFSADHDKPLKLIAMRSVSTLSVLVIHYIMTSFTGQTRLTVTVQVLQIWENIPAKYTCGRHADTPH